MSIAHKKLDNPVWHSLSEAHQGLALEFENIKFYQPDYCAFGGFRSNKDISLAIDEYAGIACNFFVVGEKPGFSKSVTLKNELVCNQMMPDKKIEVEIKENIVQLNKGHADYLFQLVNSIQPGYFRKKTFLLGNYYGVFKNNELIAVTGERMKMNEYVEISAVVTHPNHTGKGYAKQLIAHATNHVFDQGKTAYLHVAETNSPAISLYQKLGFRGRRKISFWNLEEVR